MDNCALFRTGVGHLWPAWTFDMARTAAPGFSFPKFRVQRHVKTKQHDKQVLSNSKEVTLPHSW